MWSEIALLLNVCLCPLSPTIQKHLDFRLVCLIHLSCHVLIDFPPMLQESNQLRSLSNNSSLDNKLLIEFCGATQLLGIEDDRLPAEDEYDDCDLDPALKEKIDR